MGSFGGDGLAGMDIAVLPTSRGCATGCCGVDGCVLAPFAFSVTSVLSRVGVSGVAGADTNEVVVASAGITSIAATDEDDEAPPFFLPRRTPRAVVALGALRSSSSLLAGVPLAGNTPAVPAGEVVDTGNVSAGVAGPASVAVDSS